MNNLETLKKAITKVEAKLGEMRVDLVNAHTEEWMSMADHGINSKQHRVATENLQAKQDLVTQTEKWLDEARETVEAEGNLFFTKGGDQ